MAQRNFINEWEYVEVYRDNYTSCRRFKYPEEKIEAEDYFNYLQSLDNQEKTIQLQNQNIEQLKRQNNLVKQQLELEKDRIKREAEVKENNFLINIAQNIDKGVISVDSSLRNVRMIIEKSLFHFKNQDVIFKIAEVLETDTEFMNFFIRYGEMPGVSARIVDNPSFVNVSVATLKYMIEKQLRDKTFICKLYSNNNIVFLWSGPQVLLDASTLKLLISKNLVPPLYLNWAQDTIFWIENKQRILNGDINDDKDLKFAECYYYESSFSYKFLLELANKTSYSKLLSILESQTYRLTRDQTIQVFKAILKNPNYKYNTNKCNTNLVEFLINNMNTKESLLEIKQYCTDSMHDKWLNKMQQLGFVERNERKKEIKKQSLANRNSGCAIWFIMIISTMSYIVLHYI